MAVLLALALLPGIAAAHGGVSIEDDACIMTIGPYRAHFSGYQPKLRASKEFCEDIPVVADAIIVLDFISLQLRKMQVDFRVIRDVNEIGVTATYADLGTAADIEAATVIYRDPRRYGNGNLDVSLTFNTAGTFIGILSASDPETNETYTSVFPFSVGVTDVWAWLKWVLVIFLIGLAAFFLAPKASRATPDAS